ncbi:hypothetical protein [Deinococcus sp. S9]|uniref:hypothetical protein n=1 Tax=Deinococcus sp. S9 TaxID=2545754 RepID=UPI00105579DE|nr:hypothetical protein [Deinococcus sp. S9]TDE87405.1 hypothetical protein E0686_02620 [Deinococcus sp. S9]
MSLYRVFRIAWDTELDGEPHDPQALGLPTEALVRAADPDDIADALSDEYGWCVLSCAYEPAGGPDPLSLAKAAREDAVECGAPKPRRTP